MDPICSTCWSSEPFWRKLEVLYGSQIEVKYKTGVLLSSWDEFNDPTGTVTGPSDLVKIWNDASGTHGMTINGDIWKENPIQSSLPPSLAFHAARAIDPSKSKRFMRMLSEAVFLHKVNIDDPKHIRQIANDAGYSGDEIVRKMLSQKVRQSVQKDVDDKKNWDVASYPTIVFSNGEESIVHGHTSSFDDWEHALLTLGATKNTSTPSLPELIEGYDHLSTAEISMALEMEPQTVEKHLHMMATKGLVECEEYQDGTFWEFNKKNAYAN